MTSNKASGDHARGIRVGQDRVQEANFVPEMRGMGMSYRRSGVGGI